MRRAIIGFHLDELHHWVADLSCGHTQHVRHDPPWQQRDWVTTTEGRTGKMGMQLNCLVCDELTEKQGPDSEVPWPKKLPYL